MPLATQSLINVYQFKILTNNDSNLNNLFKINLFYVLKVSTTPRMTRLHLKYGWKLMYQNQQNKNGLENCISILLLVHFKFKTTQKIFSIKVYFNVSKNKLSHFFVSLSLLTKKEKCLNLTNLKAYLIEINRIRTNWKKTWKYFCIYI